ncbi:predicted protein [Naegleria gruberi]|uniref:Predicted protein n=1 Tax=Naegleria gruberi TaxID=5762 RepID=D2VJZ3_NAEGR|nr:uncharacterized protein NAEGRDRAFT_69213 [Naegleria gruberi]EFC42856.1 predicted protein [Naegleria gruberi]|eukprot:XP_002675600.1 predicted protein [Naegleria gruberi strain NEG-M]
MTRNNYPPPPSYARHSSSGSSMINNNNQLLLDTLMYLTSVFGKTSSQGRNIINQFNSSNNQQISSIISHNLTRAVTNKVSTKNKSSKWSYLYKIVLPAVAIVGLSTLGYKLYKQIQSTREFLEGLDESEAEEQTQIKKAPVKKLVWTPKSVSSDIISSLDKQKKVINILVLYGTEFGFSKQVGMKICEEIVEKLNNKDDFVFVPRLLDLKHYNVIDWSQESCVISVCSTYGEGVPPNAALSFFESMQEKKDKSIETTSNIYYSVLALGDKSYTHFCRSGKTLDSLFESKFIQSERIHDRVDIDRDDWRSINKWLNGVVQQITERRANFTVNSPLLDYLQSDSANALSTTTQYDRTNPFFAKVTENRRICIDESNPKDIRECVHFCFDLLDDKSLKYECGDALGVLPENDSQVTETLFKYLSDFFTCEHGSSASPLVNAPSNYFSPAESSPFKNADSGMPEYITLKEAITRFYDLKQVSASLLQLLHDKQDFTGMEDLKTKLDNILHDESTLNSYIEDRWVEDVLEDFLIPLVHKSNKNTYTKSKITIQNIVDQFKVLVPRYYSISSSAVETKNEKATITVSIVTYNTLNKNRKGVATNFLKHQSIVPIFISKNRDFKLPSDTSTPIIMIGPGTGIAPFMGFIQERLNLQAKGRNILFFGCRDRNKDFLYRTELENWSKNNSIELHTAFSREDPKKKVYVQDLILENSESLYNLIVKENAHIYICGDGSSMCPAVIETFKNIFIKHESLSNDQATLKMEELEHEKRLCRDVW